MIRLMKSKEAWGTPDFISTLKHELEHLDVKTLPLQQCLLQSSFAIEDAFNVIVISVTEEAAFIRAKAGIFFSGLIPGCSCADDPTPISEYSEYCELQLDINKTTAATTVTILSP